MKRPTDFFAALIVCGTIIGIALVLYACNKRGNVEATPWMYNSVRGCYGKWSVYDDAVRRAMADDRLTYHEYWELSEMSQQLHCHDEIEEERARLIEVAGQK